MSDISVFTPRVGVDARTNLKSFIELARTGLTVFGADLPFESNVWEVAVCINQKGKYHNITINFMRRVSKGVCASPLAEPFLSFAKAYIRYRWGLRPVKNFPTILMALRELESVLCADAGSADITLIDGHILNRAASNVKRRLAPTTAYGIGLQLEVIATFLREHRLTTILADWKNHIPKVSDEVRVGKEFDEQRLKKLPSRTVFTALPEIYKLATEPGDILVSSTCAVMCSAPDRINEVVLLTNGCEVNQPNEDGSTSYGLRWWPAKGAEPQIKWIVSSMSTVVSSALNKIRAVTEPARELVRWYEAHSTQVYLPSSLEHLREEELLSLDEVGSIVFCETVSRKSVRQWCDLHGVKLERAFAKFIEVEAAIIALLPAGFPIMDRETRLLYSEALFVVPRNHLHLKKTTYRCMFEPVSITNIANRLGTRKDNMESIFSRFGFTEPDGSPTGVTTHQFRHYLNSLAQAGGLSQEDIANWSGRKDIRQNEAYDHEANGSLLERARAVIGESAVMFGPSAVKLRASPIKRDDFGRLDLATAHTTDFGYCIHDYVMSPCQIHRDCMNCHEQICLKGDSQKEAKIRQALVESERLLGLAQRALEDGEYGAEDWAEAHLHSVTRIRSLVEILDDDSVPDGSVIQLRPSGIASPIEQARGDYLVTQGSRGNRAIVEGHGTMGHN